MTTIAPGRERLDMGRVVARTFGSIGRNLATFALLAVVLTGIPTFALTWLQIGLNPATAGAAPRTAPAFAAGYVGLIIIGGLVSWILSSLLQAAVIHGVIAEADGRKASFGDCLATGLRFALPVAGVSLLFGIGVTLATLLLIVPGMILMTVWMVAVPAVVVERTGVFGALSRSGDLTRGSRWSIFGLVFVFFVVSGLVQLTVLGVTGGLAIASQAVGGQLVALPRVFGTALVGTITSIISVVGVASIYFELRANKEGVGPQNLAAVFD
ncbi:MAG TPA: hypothetical protein VII63_00850 [Caulobacteraceae bacterium]